MRSCPQSFHAPGVSLSRIGVPLNWNYVAIFLIIAGPLATLGLLWSLKRSR